MSLEAVFLRPAAWPLLLLLPLLWYFLRRLDRARSARLLAVAGPRAPFLAADLGPRRRAWRRRLALLALALGMIAILEPTWGEAVALEEGGRDLVIALDVSRSMLARDPAPSRLELARDQLRDHGPSLRGDRVALVAFAGEARLMAPLTRDLESLFEILDRCDPLAVAVGGTDLAAAVEAGVRVLDRARGGRRSIVILTDGEDLEGGGARAAARAREQGVVVHALGLGSRLGAKIPDLGPEGEQVGHLRGPDGEEVVSRLEPESLVAVATAGGGEYRGPGDGAIAALLAGEERRGARGTSADSEKGRPSRYRWPLLTAFVLLVVELALTDRRRR